MSKLLDTKILELKGRGDSLRAIAAAVGVSHTTVMRRLREMEQVSLRGIVTEDVIDRADCNIRSKPYSSRACGAPGGNGNQVSHKKTPSVMPDDDVTPRGKARRGPHRGTKEGNSPCPEDLVGDLIRFLENKGFEVYRMQNGGYQVKGNQETVRFYISRRDG